MGLMKSLSFPIIKTNALKNKNRSSSSHGRVSKGHIPVYVGEHEEEKTRFVIPISYINHPLFKEILNLAEEKYGFDPKMGALTIPCKQEAFLLKFSCLEIEQRYKF